MIERVTAVCIVEEELDRENQKWTAPGVDPLRTTVLHAEEHELVWKVYWQSEEYARTRNPQAMLIGHGPYLVDRIDGGLHRIGVVSERTGAWEADYRTRIRGLAIRTSVDDLHDEIRDAAAVRGRACQQFASCAGDCRCCLRRRPSNTCVRCCTPRPRPAWCRSPLNNSSNP
ncbi:YrhB domain-containing protein [Streptomyces sp. SM11]|uniref:YrhB domain-containing protein n=1 Tax=Streptomyces sp. SM11 TaxID=565557 RepID=UPI0027E4DAC4|nr:YrhB domain-containing protein [Streptomyces sp. SM11]